jgi:ribonuclease III
MAMDRTLVAPASTHPLSDARKPKNGTSELETRLGYFFRDPQLLKRALTHVSAAPSEDERLSSYQRLEFLGDRVLGLVVAEMLFENFPKAQEGELSQRLAHLVRRETCADAARDWGVGPFIRLGVGEAQTGGRKKTAILADVCEALIGSVFLDGGFPAARELVRQAWHSWMLAPQRPLRDAKTALQEWAQARGLAAPAYVVIERSGPQHAPQFLISAQVTGFPPAEARGSSKRLAEQAAAQAFLVREGLLPADEKEVQQ